MQSEEMLSENGPHVIRECDPDEQLELLVVVSLTPVCLLMI